MFVSVQSEKKPKRGRKHTFNAQEEGHVIRVQHHGQRPTTPNDSRDTAMVCGSKHPNTDLLH